VNPLDGSLQKKTSFYYPLLLLPRRQRRAMEILYRYCWAADDISDSNDPLPVKVNKFKLFKKLLADSFSGKAVEPFWRNFQEMVQEFHLSKEPLLRILKGVERDLKPVEFRNFSELHRYALQVAGGPGVATMEVMGFRDKSHRDYAENLGVFLQIVNITRDYQEDMAWSRQYFPSADFKRFHLHPRYIGEGTSHWKPFVQFQLDRAWGFLEKARRSLTERERGGLVTAEAIAAVYIKLYQKLRNNPNAILRGRTSLTQTDKLLSVVGSAGRCWLWKVADK
jgi:15-cis-phytoene synthase